MVMVVILVIVVVMVTRGIIIEHDEVYDDCMLMR